MSDPKKVKCPACLGTGKVLYELRDNCYSQDCPDCAGKGKIDYVNFVAITGRDGS